MKRLYFLSIFITSLFLTSSFSYGGMSCKYPNTAMQCMTCNCYNEAANEHYSGQVAVGEVVMARVGSDHWRNTICGVISKPKHFSWMNQMSSRRPVPSNHSCHKAAKKAMRFRGCKADHYHATYVRPRWRKYMSRVKRINLHIFYSKHCRRTNMVKAMQKQRNAVAGRYRNKLSSSKRQRVRKRRHTQRIYTPRVRVASSKPKRSFFDFFRRSRGVSL